MIDYPSHRSFKDDRKPGETPKDWISRITAEFTTAALDHAAEFIVQLGATEQEAHAFLTALAMELAANRDRQVSELHRAIDEPDAVSARLQ